MKLGSDYCTKDEFEKFHEQYLFRRNAGAELAAYWAQIYPDAEMLAVPVILFEKAVSSTSPDSPASQPKSSKE